MGTGSCRCQNKFSACSWSTVASHSCYIFIPANEKDLLAYPFLPEALGLFEHLQSPTQTTTTSSPSTSSITARPWKTPRCWMIAPTSPSMEGISLPLKTSGSVYESKRSILSSILPRKRMWIQASRTHMDLLRPTSMAHRWYWKSPSLAMSRSLSSCRPTRPMVLRRQGLMGIKKAKPYLPWTHMVLARLLLRCSWMLLGTPAPSTRWSYGQTTSMAPISFLTVKSLCPNHLPARADNFCRNHSKIHHATASWPKAYPTRRWGWAPPLSICRRCGERLQLPPS